MAVYTAGGLTSAGSTTLPIISLYGTAAVRPRIIEIGLFNSTATAVALSVVRLTTLGTAGTALTAAGYQPDDSAAVALAKNTHTAGPTLGADIGYRCMLGAAIGSGVVWTFPDTGLVVPAIANNGIGVVVATGTGQACHAYIVWRE